MAYKELKSNMKSNESSNKIKTKWNPLHFKYFHQLSQTILKIISLQKYPVL